VGRKREEVKYLTFEQAWELVMTTGYPHSIDTGLLELRKLYAETPSYVGDGTRLNIDGLRRIEDMAARVAGRVLTEMMLLPGVPTIEVAKALIASARDYQTQAWPSLTEPDRSLEEWILLTEEYRHRYLHLHPVTPARQVKYAAIVANLAIWAVQAALGTLDRP
jgi:hypothetical protein